MKRDSKQLVCEYYKIIYPTMISIEEQKKADEFKRQYPQHCAEFEAHMESVVTSILKELKREREAFQRSIGLIK